MKMAQPTNPNEKYATYIGEWKEGKRNGVGKYNGLDHSYHGEFMDDQFHGSGVLFSNGKPQKGLFNKGKLVS